MSEKPPRFGIIYIRKVRPMAYESMEIGLWREFNVGEADPEEEFKKLVAQVEAWIEERRNELIKKRMEGKR